MAAAFAMVAFITVSNILAASKEHPAGVIFLANDTFLPAILKDMGESASEIKCAIYMFRTDGSNRESTQLLLDAMLDALERNIEVSIVFDVGKEDELTTEYNLYTGSILARGGALIVYDSPEQRLHTKMCVIDRHITFLGSHNYTFSGLKRNSEVSVRIRSQEFAEDALNYLKEFGI